MVMKGEFFNSKKKKEFLQVLKEQYGIDNESFIKSFEYFLSDKNRLYIVEKSAAEEFLSLNIKTISFGNYIGSFDNDGKFRFSIEGSQIFGPYSRKCVLELNKCLAQTWLAGEKISLKEFDEKTIAEIKKCSYLIMKFKKDFLGCGKVGKEFISNFVPKERRVKDIDF